MQHTMQKVSLNFDGLLDASIGWVVDYQDFEVKIFIRYTQTNTNNWVYGIHKQEGFGVMQVSWND